LANRTVISQEHSVYSESERKLDRQVEFKTLLESNLDFEKERIFDTRHSWHSFPAKFPPQLPNTFINRLTFKGETVLDPMMGSATTLIEAAKAERHAIGFDIDPLDLMIAKSKLSQLEPQELYTEGMSLIERSREHFKTDQEQLKKSLTNKFDQETKLFIDFWFLHETQLEIFAILTELKKVSKEEYKAFFRAVLSGVIITKSGGVSLARDLAHTRPHKDQQKKPKSVFNEFHKRLKKNLANYSSLSSKNVCIEEANAQNLPIDDRSVDLIITSPPYANNAIDYIRAHKFSLVWFGYTLSQLRDKRKEFVGSVNKAKEKQRVLPVQVIEKIQELEAKSKSKAQSLKRYYLEMQSVISEYHRVLKPNRACVLVIGTSKLNNIDTETHNCLSAIGNDQGFKTLGIGTRNIYRNKRMMPTSNKNSGKGIEARMHQEYVLGFWKE